MIDTPIEEHGEILVKREDLCTSDDPRLPPLSKSRGLLPYVEKRASKGVRKFGVMDTRVSKSGQMIAAICQDLGVECLYFCPKTKTDEDWMTEPRAAARASGADLRPIQAGRTAVVYAQSKRQCEKEGGLMLPLGFGVSETVEETIKVVRKVPEEALGGTIVVPTGTATILAGILATVLLDDISTKVIVGVSAGMDPKKQSRRVTGHLDRAFKGRSSWDSRVRLRAGLCRLLKGKGEYYDPATVSTPFPAHSTYEGKAWEWLEERLLDEQLGGKKLPRPILFWNIGA